MRLTNKHRCAFVVAVMADVPSVDYKQQEESLVVAALLEAAPATVRELYKDDPRWLNLRYTYTPIQCLYSGLLPPGAGVHGYLAKNMPEVFSKCELLADKHHAQEAERAVLQNKVRAVISGCATLKQAKERLPEFVKYLPQPERKATPNLPSTTDVFDSLTKAGWPKGGA